MDSTTNLSMESSTNLSMMSTTNLSMESTNNVPIWSITNLSLVSHTNIFMESTDNLSMESWRPPTTYLWCLPQTYPRDPPTLRVRAMLSLLHSKSRILDPLKKSEPITGPACCNLCGDWRIRIWLAPNVIFDAHTYLATGSLNMHQRQCIFLQHIIRTFSNVNWDEPKETVLTNMFLWRRRALVVISKP